MRFSRFWLLLPTLLFGVLMGFADQMMTRAQVLIGLFPDVAFDHPSYDAVDYLARNGIVGGYPDGTFQPDRLINRAEFTKIVIGSLFTTLDIEGCLTSLPQTLRYTQTLIFPDVAQHQWFAKFVCKAKLAGMISGYPDGTFRPAINVNFVEAAKILAGGFKLPLPAVALSDDPWFRLFVEALAKRRAIPHSVRSLDQQITRGEMAEMIYRLYAKIDSLPSRTYEELAAPLSPTPASSVPSSFPSSLISSRAFPLLSSLPFSPTSIEYSQRLVTASGGSVFTVDVITADLEKGVRALTVAAQESDCTSDCTALSLQEYVQRRGGLAGINGTYFCPPDQIHCAAQKNAFVSFLYNTLSQTFLNADKRSLTNAGGLFVFRPGSIAFYEKPADFSPDPRITGAITSWPILLAGGKIVLDPASVEQIERTAEGTLGALGNKGNTLYLLVARSASLPDLAKLLQAMELENGISIDGGKSSALLYRGTYKVGPGRALPNALILAP